MIDRGARPSTSALDAAQRSHLERPFKCLECHHAFRRVEHLTRHARSHRTERYLECSYCRKGFYRLYVGPLESKSRDYNILTDLIAML
jgi:DNA-directed RNA polymerase subunit RPC12/RpoP